MIKMRKRRFEDKPEVIVMCFEDEGVRSHVLGLQKLRKARKWISSLKLPEGTP